MKKVLFALMFVSGMASAHVGGLPNITEQQMKDSWNGVAGEQRIQTSGVVVKWVADANGNNVNK